MASHTVAESLDYLGKKRRQRKLRIITIDKGREDKDGITGLLLSGMGYTIEYRQLPLGDYAWDSKLGQVIVERKTPSDIRDIPRLSTQLRRLREGAASGAIFPVLLIDWRASESPWEEMILDNIEMSCQGSIHVAHCLQGQLAHRLDNLYMWSNKYRHELLEVVE